MPAGTGRWGTHKDVRQRRGKTHLQHLFMALATNIERQVDRLEGSPFAKTQH